MKAERITAMLMIVLVVFIPICIAVEVHAEGETGNTNSTNTTGPTSTNETNSTWDTGPTTPTTTINATGNESVVTNIPSLTANNVLSIHGTTLSGVQVKVFLNNELKLVGTTDLNGDFSFAQLTLTVDGNNIIKLVVNSTIEKTYTVFLDRTLPQLSIGAIPPLIIQNSWPVNGTINKNTTINFKVHTMKAGLYDDPPTFDQSIEATGSFSEQITLNEGENYIVITATDIVNNQVKKDFVVYSDTKPPQITTSNLGDISPSYISHVKLRGNVSEPGIDVIGIVNGKVDARTKADSSGNFEMEIELTKDKPLYSSTSGTQAVGGEGYQTTEQQTDTSTISNFQSANQWENTVQINATDKVGNVGIAGPVTVYLQRCGQGGDWMIDIGETTPSVLVPELIERGLAQFGFEVKLLYQGPGNPNTAKIKTMPHIEVRTDMSNQEKEQYQEEFFGSAVATCSDDNQQCYITITLKSVPYDDFKKLNFMKFPLKIIFDYENPDLVTPYRPGDGHQEQCWDVVMQVDKGINANMIPKELLEKTIKALDTVIEALDKVTKPLEQVRQYAFAGCIASWFHLWMMQSIVKAKCSLQALPGGVSAYDSAVQAIKTADQLGDDVPEKYCPVQGGSPTPEAMASCTSCVESLMQLRKSQTTMQWVCDRTFCPAAPKLDEHARTYKDPITKDTVCQSKADLSKPGCEKEYKRAWDSVSFINEWEKLKAYEEPQSIRDIRGYTSGGMCGQQDAKEGLYVRSSSSHGRYVVYNGDVYYVSGEFGNVEVQNNQFVFGDKQTVPVSDSVKVTDLLRKKDDIAKLENLRTRVAESERAQISEEINNLQEGYDKDVDAIYKDPKASRQLSGLPPEQLNNEMKGMQEEDILSSNKKYVFDPTSGIIASFESACMPYIVGYLKLYQNMAKSLKRCFKTLHDTGNGSSGYCKAVVSMYVCDLVFDNILCNAGKLTSGKSRIGGDFNIFSMLSGSSSNANNAVQNRYGSSNYFQAMFTERKLIHSTCLGFFGIDAGISAQESLEAELSNVYADSEVFIYPATRRYVSSNPANFGRAKFAYHIGAGLFAGADLTYSLKLICSADNTCGGADYTSGVCDCFGLGEQMYTISSGTLQNGEVFGEDQNTGDIYLVLELPYRFDKAELTWRFKDAHGEMTTHTKTEDIKGIGEPSPSECIADGNGFRCNIFVGERGVACFSKPPVITDVVGIGDTIPLDYVIDTAGKDSNGNVYIKGVEASLTNQNNALLFPTTGSQEGLIIIDTEGSHSAGQLDNFPAGKIGPITDVMLNMRGNAQAACTASSAKGIAPQGILSQDVLSTLLGGGTGDNNPACDNKYLIARYKSGDTFVATAYYLVPTSATTTTSPGSSVTTSGYDIGAQAAGCIPQNNNQELVCGQRVTLRFARPLTESDVGALMVIPNSQPSTSTDTVCKEGDIVELKLQIGIINTLKDRKTGKIYTNDLSLGEHTYCNGKEQVYPVTVKVRCGQGQGENLGPCGNMDGTAENKNRCVCGKEQRATYDPSVDCNGLYTKYCYETDGKYSCHTSKKIES